MDSGNAGVYMVNCDDAVISNNVIHRADEWGLDIVDGSNNVTADNNEIKWSFWGAVVFDEADNGGGTFTNNDFISNNLGGGANCNGISVIGNMNNVSHSGNYANPNSLICVE
jgi:hypothetical protein